MDDAQPVTPGLRDSVLDALLARRDVRVAAIDASGLFVAPPPELMVSRDRLISDATTVLDLVVAGDYQAVIDAWETAYRLGAGHAVVRLTPQPGPAMTLDFIDARHRYGVFVGVLSAYRTPDDAGQIAANVCEPSAAWMHKDARAVVLAVDDALTRLLGWSAGQLIGTRSLDLVHPDDQQRAIASWMDLLASPKTSHRIRLRHRHRDGSWMWLEVTNTNRLADPDNPMVIAELADASTRIASLPRQADTEAQRFADAMLDSLLRHCDAVGGAVAVLNHGRPWASAERALPDGVDVATQTAQAVGGVAEATYPGGTLLVLPAASDGALIGLVSVWCRGTVDPTTRTVTAMLADNLATAVEALHTTERRIRAASHDNLTGLVNRDRFLDLVRLALERGRRTGRAPGLLVVGIDRFTAICDRLGPAAGDQVLLETASRLTGVLRGEDTPARFSDDGFAVLLADAENTHDTMAVARRLYDQVNAPLQLGGRPTAVTMSVGIAVAAAESTAESLFTYAEAAADAARRAGGQRIKVFDPGMQASAERRSRLRTLLANAIGRGELDLAYQPIVDARTCRVAGVEALLRWTSGEYGAVSPAEFIPLAEQTGNIHAIGGWVLRRACEQAYLWQRGHAGHCPYVSVNLSALQVTDEQLPSMVAELLAATRLPAERLVLELTESVFVRDAARVHDHLRQLRDQGVRLALDDFGTGYSSLSYLQRFQFDLIKLDKSFIDHLGTATSSALVRGVLQLSRALNIATVAEGVECPEQAAELVRLRCDFVQGYLFGRPVPGERIDEIVNRDSVRGGRARG